jgi:glycosyltransferase involved in cell wall biosynthesis
VRLALVLPGRLDRLSGGYLYDRILVEQLCAAGDEVAVLSLPLLPFGVAALGSLTVRLVHQLARLQPAAVLEDELAFPTLAWTNRLIRRRIRAPLVAIVHHLRQCEQPTGLTGLLTRLLEPRFLASVDAFLFPSEASRKEALAWRCDQPDHALVPPGRDRLGPPLERAVVLARACRPGPLRILSVGTVERRKNLDGLLRALAALPAGSWQLTVVGPLDRDRAFVRRLQRLIVRQGLAGAVQLTGQVDDTTLRALLTAHDVLAQPSWYEGFGIAALEGLGFGLPAIVSSAGGGRTVIEEGVSGLVVAPDDPIGLATALRSLLDRQRLAAMSEAALAHYHRHPTWQEAGQQARQFLRTLVAAKEG